MDPDSGGIEAAAGPTDSGSVLRTTVKSADEVRYDSRAGGGAISAWTSKKNMCSHTDYAALCGIVCSNKHVEQKRRLREKTTVSKNTISIWVTLNILR